MTRWLVLIPLLLHSTLSHSFDSGRATFSLHINDLVVPYRVFAIFAMPGEELELVVPEPAQGSFELVSDAGSSPGSGFGSNIGPQRQNVAWWTVQAPQEPGLYKLEVHSAYDRIRINLFVLHSAELIRDGRLDGYDIGEYPKEPLHGDAVYNPPAGFVQLNSETASARLSPHFTLSQFPSKQSQGLPKYLILREHLLLKLELLLEDVNAQGIATDSFVIMSGFRTPRYNKDIGNVEYSRHVYGGAADIYIDVNPRDGDMDDLNGDGRFNYHDVQYLYELADRLFAEGPNQWLTGGQGIYRRNAFHGPFLHVDARGTRARWGLLPSAGSEPIAAGMSPPVAKQ